MPPEAGGVSVDSLEFLTNIGFVRFDCWEIAAHVHKMDTLRDEYELRFDCAAILFDVTRRSTRKNVSHMHREIKKVCGEDTPVVLCGTKADAAQLNHPVPAATTAAASLRVGGLRYCELSAKSGRNVAEPFLYLTAELMKHHTTEEELRFLSPLRKFTIESAGWEECVDRMGMHGGGRSRVRLWR